MSLSPYMRAHFENSAEKDRREREAEAAAERKAHEEEQRMQKLQQCVAKFKPILEQVAKDATILNRIGVAGEQIFSSHAALSAKLGVTDGNRIVASLTVRIEGEGSVNVSISILDQDPAYGSRQVGEIDHLGSVNDADIVQQLNEGIFRAIASAMKAADEKLAR